MREARLSLSLSLSLSPSLALLSVSPSQSSVTACLSPAFLAPGVSVLGQQSSHCIWHRFSAEKPMCEARARAGTCWNYNRRYRFLVKTSGAWPRASRGEGFKPTQIPPREASWVSTSSSGGRCGRRIRLYPGSGPGVRSTAFMSLGEELLRENVEVEGARVFKVGFCRAQRDRLSSEGHSDDRLAYPRCPSKPPLGRSFPD